MKSTIESNQHRICVARDSARGRIRAILRNAIDSLALLGRDSHEARILARRVAGLKPDDDSLYIMSPDNSVGIDATGTYIVSSELTITPEQLDTAMLSARKLVHALNEGITKYMMADDARTDVLVSQFEASAR